jgi:hypothetical protein
MPASRTDKNRGGARSLAERCSPSGRPPALLDPGAELLAGLLVVTAELQLIAQNVRTWRDGTPTPRRPEDGT